MVFYRHCVLAYKSRFYALKNAFLFWVRKSFFYWILWDPLLLFKAKIPLTGPGCNFQRNFIRKTQTWVFSLTFLSKSQAPFWIFKIRYTEVNRHWNSCNMVFTTIALKNYLSQNLFKLSNLWTHICVKNLLHQKWVELLKRYRNFNQSTKFQLEWRK